MSTKISATTLSALLALMPQLEVAAADSHKPEANSHGVDTVRTQRYGSHAHTLKH